MLTLHKYLSRDLIKTAVLAVLAFTLIMTMFAIIEPLRKQGLNPGQAVKVFWYTMPVMLSLTLPIAALFSATIVYGRFSMDNELTACRASGVSTWTLLKPVWVMGVVVTALTLILSNWVAPKLTRQLEIAVKSDLRSLIYQQLRAKAYWKIGNRLIHADESSPNFNMMQGVVAIDFSDPANVEFAVASAAYVDFEGDNFKITSAAATLGKQQGFSMYSEAGEHTVGPFPLPSQTKEDPKFYDWAMLGQILERPETSEVVKLRLTGIKEDYIAGRLYDRMAEAINSGKACQLQDAAGNLYIFTAPAAQPNKGKKLVLQGAGIPKESDNPVVIVVHDASGKTLRTFKCRQAEMVAKYQPAVQDLQIRADLSEVLVYLPTEPTENAPRHDEYHIGPLLMPSGIADGLDGVESVMYRSSPDQFPAVQDKLAKLRGDIVNMQRQIIAEIHGRLAYGIGCFLLVVLGAALGLVFRGGQILSAFAISCIPAMILVVTTIMGKQMITNPGVVMNYGLGALWGGLALLVAMMAYVYGFLLRR